MSVIAALSGNGTGVVPGAESTLQLMVRNEGATVDEFELLAKGPLSRHVVFDRSTVSLFPGDETSVSMALRVPRTSTVAAGTYPVAVLVTSTVDRSRTAVPESSVTVEPFAAVEASLRPQCSRGSSRARHVLDITNVGNVPSTMNITPSEPDELLRLEPRVEALRLEPGERRSVNVVVRSLSQVLQGAERRPFQLLVYPTDGPSASVDGAMKVVPSLLRRFGKPVLAAAAVLVALALWLGTRKGEPQSQVRDLPVTTSSAPATVDSTALTIPASAPTTVVEGAPAQATTTLPSGPAPTTTQPAPPASTPRPAPLPPILDNVPAPPPPAQTTTTQPPPAPVNTVFTTTADAVWLDLGGGAVTTVAGIDVPPGVWAIDAESSVIAFDTADYIRCALFDGGSQLDASTVFVGGASTTPYAAISNLVAFTATAPTRIELRCTHDSTLPGGTRLYIDPSASMVATRATGVISASTAASTVLGSPAQVTSVNLAAGMWLVESKASVVNFGPLDYVRCNLVSGAAAVDGGTTTVGASPGSPAVATSRNAAVVTLTSATVVSLNCSEDGSSTAAYADPGAQLLAVPLVAGMDTRTTGSTPTPVAPSLSTVNALDLPAGEWTVVAKGSAVSWDAGSAVRCRVVAAGAVADQRVVLIGGATNPVSVISNVAHVAGAAGVHVESQCSDDQHPNSFVDPGAALVAFRT